MTINDLEYAYIVYLELNKKENTMMANLWFLTFLKCNTSKVRNLVLNETNDIEPESFSESRLKSLLSPHAATLYRAALKKDGFKRYWQFFKVVMLLWLPITLKTYLPWVKDA